MNRLLKKQLEGIQVTKTRIDIIANAINKSVCGENCSTPDYLQRKEIRNKEIYLSNLIRDGFINTYTDIMKLLDKTYKNESKFV